MTRVPAEHALVVECTAKRQDGRFADSPNFRADVWPMLLARASEVNGIFVFGSRLLQVEVERLGPCSRILGGILSLGPLSLVTQTSLDFLRSRGTDDYLDALFQMDAEAPLLWDLAALWPTRQRTAVDRLLLSPAERRGLEKFLSQMDARRVVAGFGEDGDPMFLFGSSSALVSVIQ